MNKKQNKENEIVTRSILKEEFKEFRKEFKKEASIDMKEMFSHHFGMMMEYFDEQVRILSGRSTDIPSNIMILRDKEPLWKIKQLEEQEND